MAETCGVLDTNRYSVPGVFTQEPRVDVIPEEAQIVHDSIESLGYVSLGAVWDVEKKATEEIRAERPHLFIERPNPRTKKEKLSARNSRPKDLRRVQKRYNAIGDRILDWGVVFANIYQLDEVSVVEEDIEN
jgi:hypothetical protein